MAILHVVTMHDYGQHDVVGVYDSRERADAAIVAQRKVRGCKRLEYAVDVCVLNGDVANCEAGDVGLAETQGGAHE